MRPLLIITLLFAFLYNTSAQTGKTVELAKKILPIGNQKAAITTYEFPDEIKTLQEKATRNLKANPEWADKYIVRMIMQGVDDISYMDEYGLSKEEFAKMIAGFKSRKQAVYTDTFNLAIKLTGEIISFKGEKKLSAYDHLKIDTKTKQISYDNLLITNELAIEGKFYAPILYGFETHNNVNLPIKKRQTQVINAAGFSIGKNKGNDKPTLCLILTKPGSDRLPEIEFLTITIL